MRKRRRRPAGAAKKPSGPTAAERAAWASENPSKVSQGWFLDSQGYVARMTRKSGRRSYEREHRVVMEAALGRKLLSKETVHHRNGDRADNRFPENLELWVTHQPSGQRPHELLQFAYEIIERYGHAGDQGNPAA